ncbi:MAG TPA: hypothetical protein ENH82_09065 [bacterium]|nr:hypothetical protein [bacterium]
MAEKVKDMLKSNIGLCVLVLIAIGVTSIVFAADFKVKEGALEEGVVFGEWITADSNSDTFAKYGIYQATSDGFVVAWVMTDQGASGIELLSDSNSAPETIIAETYSSGPESSSPSRASITVPIKKGDYWRIQISSGEYNYAIFWLPLGKGGAPVKQ